MDKIVSSSPTSRKAAIDCSSLEIELHNAQHILSEVAAKEAPKPISSSFTPIEVCVILAIYCFTFKKRNDCLVLARLSLTNATSASRI